MKFDKKVLKSWKFYLFLYLLVGISIGFVIPLINDGSLGTSFEDNIVMTFGYPLFLLNSAQGNPVPKGLAVGDISSNSNNSNRFFATIFGYVQCGDSGQPYNSYVYTAESAKHQVYENGLTFYVVTCSDYFENNGCTITLQTPKSGDSSLLGVGVFDGICNSATSYSQCSAGSEGIFGSVYRSDTKSYTKYLLRNQYLIFNYQTAGSALNNPSNRQGLTFTVNGNVYSLQTYSPTKGGFQSVLGATTCGVTSSVIDYSGNHLLNKIVTSSTFGIAGNAANAKNPTYVQIGQPFNYVDNFFEVTASFQKGTSQPGYYCVGSTGASKLLPVQQFTTADGQSYNVVNTDYNNVNAKPVGCCDGQALPGYICQNNNLVKVEQAQCDLTRPCPGSSQWNIDSSDQSQKTALIYSCVQNKCVATRKTVQCVTSLACSTGQICQFDYGNPDNSKCVTPSPGVLPNPPPTGGGSGLCTNCFKWFWNKITGEKYCTPVPTEKVLGFISIPLTSQSSICPLFLIILLGILLVLGSLVFIAYKKSKGKGKRRK